MKDVKEALSSTRKPDITHVRLPLMVYVARACEYGNAPGARGYDRANYLRPTGTSPTPTRADFERFRAYLRANMSHVAHTLEAMEHHLSRDPNLEDVEGMKRACFARDTDAPPGTDVPPSLLPHVAPAASSLMMAITQAVDCGLLPADPGQTWGTAPEPPKQKDSRLGLKTGDCVEWFTLRGGRQSGKIVAWRSVGDRFDRAQVEIAGQDSLVSCHPGALSLATPSKTERPIKVGDRVKWLTGSGASNYGWVNELTKKQGLPSAKVIYVSAKRVRQSNFFLESLTLA